MRPVLLTITLFALVASSVGLAPGAALAQSTPTTAAMNCPATMPVSQIRAGDTGYGLTVARGTTPESFDVLVGDVLADAIAPGMPLIVVEVDSPEIRRVGGIWSGMSGSPVYIGGKLIGAVAYGFSFGPSTLGGVTPAAAMLAVPDRPTLSAASLPDEIDMSGRVQSLARTAGVTTAQARAMGQLQVPVGVSGLHGEKFTRFANAFERAHPNTQVVRSTGGTATGAAAGSIVAGGNLAVSLSYGDVSAVGIGTVTTVCNGVVTGFGHPMLFDGATRMGMHSATTVRIVDDAVFGPYKLANAGPPVGTIDQDRLAAVAGRLGPRPATTAVTSRITNADTGTTTVGRTDSVAPDQLFASVLLHGWVNYDYLVFDDWGFEGTSEVSWTMRGLRADGTPWSVTRDNRHASRYDLSSESLFEAAITAQTLDDNPFEDVTVTEVDYRATGGSPYAAYEIVAGDVMVSTDGSTFYSARLGVSATPGGALTVRVPLRQYRGAVETVEVQLDVPNTAAGWGALVVGNPQEGDGDLFDCLYDPEYCQGPVADDFDDLLDGITSRSRSDDLTVSLLLFPEFDDGGEFGPGFDEPIAPVASVTRRLDEVVRGRAEFQAVVEGGDACPVPSELPFLDVDPWTTHAGSVGCAFTLGLVRGVSSDPPLFAPDRPVRRDAVATMIANLLDQGPRSLPPSGSSEFTDLGGNVHRTAIERLAVVGVTSGRTPTTYDPRGVVTREQLASLLIAAAEWAGDTEITASGSSFEDVSPTHAANVDAAVELGVLRGYGDGTFRGRASMRRDQMATVLVRSYTMLTAG